MGHSHKSKSGAKSKKPRLVRGLMLPQGLLSRFEVFVLAEREGFEPSVMLPPRLISSQVHSTTLPPLLNSPLRLVTAANSISSLYARNSVMPPI